MADPVAKNTDWGPAAGGGQKLITHRLASGGNKYYFRRSIGLWLIIALIAAMAGIIMWAGVTQANLVGVGISLLLFAVIYYYFFFHIATTNTFDLTRRVMVCGKKDDAREIPFDDLHALQLVSEIVTSSGRRSKSKYLCHELNVVLKTGERINLTDHSGIKALRRDAQRLAAAIDKPVWDHGAARRPELRIAAPTSAAPAAIKA